MTDIATPTTTRQTAANAAAAGYAAQRRGEFMTCPATYSTDEEQLWWTRGWLAALADLPGEPTSGARQDRAAADRDEGDT